MRIIGPRPQITVIPTVKSARPPDAYLELLTQNEQEFRDYVRRVESQPTFQHLIEEGYVRKAHFRGRIPRHLYEEFQDKQFIEFMRTFEIEKHNEWQRDFFREDARKHVKALSVKYKAPRGRLIHALEYCRYLKRAWDGHEEERNLYDLRLDDPEFREPPTAQASLESPLLTETLAHLMDEYEVTQSEFVEYFMESGADPEWIGDELGIPQRVVHQICDLVERVQIASSMQVTVVDAPADTSSHVHAESIATVQQLNHPPRAEIYVMSEVEYNSRYQIQTVDGEVDEQTTGLIGLLRLINQRKSLTFRVLMFIFEYQYRYFVSQNDLYLKPLTQAQVATELGEHESTVSRILHDKYLDTTGQVLPLKFFCQSKGEVIHRLIAIREQQELASGARQKPYSDAELAEILEREYNTKIARRTVTYYRNKFRETPKFYTRRRKVKKT